MKSINLKKIISSMLAVMMITTLAGNKVVSAEENTKVRPRVSVHDPSIAKDKNGTYYVFGSHIDAAKSMDLKNWTVFTNGYAKTDNVLFGDLSKNLAESFDWAGENDSDSKGGFSVWAPTVFYNETYVNKDGSTGAYMMYYCTSSTYKRSAIGFAVSQNIEGPYEYVDTIMYSGFTKVDNYDANSNKNTIYTNTNIDELINDKKIEDGLNDKWFSSNGQYNTSYAPNAIDPELFYDSEGKLWMTYGSWSGGVYILEVDKTTGKLIYPGADSNTDSLNFTDRYFGTRISGGYGKSGEGADVVYDKEAGYYYMTVTYAGLSSNGGYNMRLFRAKNPQGPYLDAKGQNAVLPGNISNEDYGIKLISNYKFDCQEKALKAAGHNSVLLDDDGERYLIHHQRFDNSGEYHEVRVHKLLLSEDGWLIVAPYEYNGEKESDIPYDLSEVMGNYQFINHGNSNGPTIESTLNISLNEDYTISGDLNGTWERTEKNNVNLTIDGSIYKGVFLEQEDESNTVNKVMTFSAIGDNNLSIWGSKVSSNDKGTAEYVARYLNNIIPSEVRKNIELPVVGSFGTTITWESSNSNLLDTNGIVNRGEKDTSVTLKATVKKGEAIATNEFTINVVGLLQEVGVSPSYRYEFENETDKKIESTGLESDSGTLVGNANIVKDEERGNVVEIKSDTEVRKENYFKLPEDTFNNVTAEDGYTVSMWINLNKSNPNYWEHSAIFEAKAAVDYPMTRLGANLLGRINSNGAWADTQVGSKQIESRKWNYVTFTVSGKGIVVYLDGYEVARDNKDVTASFKDNFLAQMMDVRVGSGDIWNDKDLAEAKFDNIEVYKKSLNESQVEALYYQELKVEEEKPVELIKPLYKYNFESVNKNEVVNSGIKDEIGILLGNSTVIKDEERGNVLEIKGEDKDGINYFKLPENTFDGITEEGYTLSMWVNLDKAYKNYNEHSALFDASNNQEFPMTRLGANLIGRINSNGVWSDTFNVNKQLTSKKWEYVTFSVNKYGIVVYINGEEVAREDKDISKAFENNALSILKDVRIGSGSVWTDKDIAYAKFDNIAFYNRALSEKEVVVLYEEETKVEEPTNPEIPVIPEEPNTPEAPEDNNQTETPNISEDNNKDDNTEVIPGDVDNDTDKNQNNDSNNNINNESELPQTGGNNPVYLVLLSLIVVGIGGVLLLKRKNKKEA